MMQPRSFCGIYAIGLGRCMTAHAQRACGWHWLLQMIAMIWELTANSAKAVVLLLPKFKAYNFDRLFCLCVVSCGITVWRGSKFLSSLQEVEELDNGHVKLIIFTESLTVWYCFWSCLLLLLILSLLTDCLALLLILSVRTGWCCFWSWAWFRWRYAFWCDFLDGQKCNSYQIWIDVGCLNLFSE